MIRDATIVALLKRKLDARHDVTRERAILTLVEWCRRGLSDREIQARLRKVADDIPNELLREIYAAASATGIAIRDD